MSDEEEKKPIDYAAIRRMVWPMARPYAPLGVALVLLSAALACLSVAEPYIYGSIVDSIAASVSARAEPTEGFAAILPYLGAWTAVMVATTLLVALQAWGTWYLGNMVCRSANEGMFERMLRLTVRRFQDERGGAMLNRFVSTDEAMWGLNTQMFRSVLQSLMTFTAIVAVGSWLDWRLMLVALAVIPVCLLLARWNLYTSSVLQEGLGEKWEEANGLVGDAFSNIATVQSAAGERRSLARFAKAYGHVLVRQLKLNARWAFLEAGTGGSYIVGRLLLFVVGVRFVLDGSVSLGTLITFLGLAGALYGTVQAVGSELPMAVKSLNRLSRAARIWEEIPEIRDREDARPAPAFRGDVTLDGVWFSYPDADRPVLRSVSVDIPAGRTLAIVGESGAGKSTVAKLLVRFADPTRGSVRFDGTDIREYSLATLRPQVGFVMQENMLFHETILHNIRFGRPDATREDVMAAAKRAQAHEFISKLPKGYDTVVGERGVKLSGGQKQRVAIARVLLADPPILVLDEATSALDSKTERDLQAALREVMRGRTTVVIAHRLSTVMDADEILVMDRGRVVDRGTHAELVDRDNLYRKFWEIQAGGYA